MTDLGIPLKDVIESAVCTGILIGWSTAFLGVKAFQFSTRLIAKNEAKMEELKQEFLKGGGS